MILNFCFIIFLFFLYLEITNSKCVNFCNGHGSCIGNECYCNSGWKGGAPDCSLRTCSYGIAWADKAYDIDLAHSTAECSNAGVCDRKTGVCKCFPGYTGTSCEKLSCGSTNCNGHGECISMNSVYQVFTSDNSDVSQYTNWEGKHVTMCMCHIGYSGPDCSYKLCPKGDDPVTVHSDYRTIQINLYAKSSSTGHFKFSFNGQSFLIPVHAWNGMQCKYSFETLPNIGTVNCTMTIISAVERLYTVKFLTFPTIPYENNIYTHDGNPSITSFSCDASMVSPTSSKPQCHVINVETTSVLPEYSFCSNRGICNFNKGTCSCSPQFTNSNCDTYSEALSVTDEVQSDVIVTIKREYDQSKGSNLRLYSSFYETSDFNFLKITDSDSTIFTIDSAGNVNLNYGSLLIQGKDTLHQQSGLTIGHGGLVVKGGATINSYGLYSQDGWESNIGVVIKAGGARLNDGDLKVFGDTQITGGMTITSTGLRIAEGLIADSGGMTINLGGLNVISNGTSVASGGLVNYRKGVTIYSGGLYVNSGLVNLKGISSTINLPDGLTINSGGIYVNSGISIQNSGLYSDVGVAGMRILGGGLPNVSSINILSGGFIVTSGISVSTNGVKYSGSSGITVNSGGLRVLNSLKVSSASTIASLGLNVTDGITIFNSGLAISGSSTVNSIDITSGKLLVRIPGANITGNVSIESSGLRITGGATINGGINVVSGGVTIKAFGVTVSSGDGTISGGLFLNSKFSVNSGLAIAGGLSVLNGGLVDTGLLNITGPLYSANGLSIQSGGFNYALNSSTSLVIKNIGLSTSGGVSVIGTSPLITGGLTIVSGGIIVTSGDVLIPQGPLKVPIGGINISQSGLILNAGDIVISNSGLVISDTFNISNKLTITGGATISGGLSLNNDVTIQNGVAVTSGNINFTNLIDPSFLKLSSGLLVTGGVTLYDVGLKVPRMTVNSNLVNIITGGLSVLTGGFYTSVLEVNDKLSVKGGVTIVDTGLIVNAVGVTISNSGLSIDTLNSTSSNTYLTGGLTIRSGGLTVNSSMTINNRGLLTPTLSINSNGLVCTGGSTIFSGGLIASYLDIKAGGLYAANVMNVLDTGLLGSVLTVTPNGIKITDGGITIKNIGLLITGGVSVPNVGMVSELSIRTTSLYSDFVNVTGGVRLKEAMPLNIYSGGLIVYNDTTVYGLTRLENSATTSDFRLKQNLTEIQDPLSKVLQLHGYYYQLKNDLTKKKYIGVIAQEVLKVFPELVEIIPDTLNFLSVRYEELIPILISAIQELDHNYKEYEAKLEAKRLKSLEKQKCHCVKEIKKLFQESITKLEQLEREEKELISLFNTLSSQSQ